MALVRNWRMFRYGGPTAEIKNECKTLDLRGAKKILIKFDPFREDTKHIRNFNHHLLSFRALKTNPHLLVKTEILNDRSEPTVTVDLINEEQLLMKCAHLKTLDLFKALNEYVTPLAPDDIVGTHPAKLAGKKKLKKK